ncbi:MAG: hypothetical protein M1822_004429 [Bathelium mastoideum]|nr:MAG: hypothetical protein M1822_004429 [Bathelium mastoideum]
MFDLPQAKRIRREDLYRDDSSDDGATRSSRSSSRPSSSSEFISVPSAPAPALASPIEQLYGSAPPPSEGVQNSDHASKGEIPGEIAHELEEGNQGATEGLRGRLDGAVGLVGEDGDGPELDEGRGEEEDEGHGRGKGERERIGDDDGAVASGEGEEEDENEDGDEDASTGLELDLARAAAPEVAEAEEEPEAAQQQHERPLELLHNPTTTTITTHQTHARNDNEDQDDALAFHLFAPTSLSTRPPAIVRLRSPTPQSAGFVQPQRPSSYYFASPSAAQRAEYASAAVSGAEVQQLAQRAWPGCVYGWRVVRVVDDGKKGLGTGKGGKRKRRGKREEGETWEGVEEDAGGDGSAAERVSREEAGEGEKRKRPGKKARVRTRKRVAKGKAEEETEREVKERRARNNREKRERQRERDKVKKANAKGTAEEENEREAMAKKNRAKRERRREREKLKRKANAKGETEVAEKVD